MAKELVEVDVANLKAVCPHIIYDGFKNERWIEDNTYIEKRTEAIRCLRPSNVHCHYHQEIEAILDGPCPFLDSNIPKKH